MSFIAILIKKNFIHRKQIKFKFSLTERNYFFNGHGECFCADSSIKTQQSSTYRLKLNIIFFTLISLLLLTYTTDWVKFCDVIVKRFSLILSLTYVHALIGYRYKIERLTNTCWVIIAVGFFWVKLDRLRKLNFKILKSVAQPDIDQKSLGINYSAKCFNYVR